MQATELNGPPSERARLLRPVLLALDLLVGLAGVAIVVALGRWLNVATHDQFKIEWILVVSAPFLLLLSGLFLLAAIGHWRRYSWRWLVQWFAVGTAVVLATAVLLL